MSVPFVGRRQEGDALTNLVRRVRHDRRPAAALVSGEPGTGKTRLLAEVLSGPRAVPIIRVVGFEPNASVPLAAVAEVLRHLSAVPGSGPTLEALAFGRRERPTRDPLRIFEAAHHALASFGPLVIAIDDLQWMDDVSLGLIHHLLRAAEASHQPLGVIAAARPSSAASTFRTTIESSTPSERRVLIELGPLPLADGVSLARAVDHRLDEAAAVELWRRARGSPFWVEALARSGSRADPASLIGDRLGALTGDAGASLAAWRSVATFFADDVAEFLMGRQRARHATRELVTRARGIEGAARCAEPRPCEAATEGVPRAARRRLHARLAEWIEHEAGDDLALLREALDHRLAAGLPAAPLAARLLASPGRRLLSGEDLRVIAGISDALAPGRPMRVGLDRGIGELAASIGELEFALERWSRVGEEANDASERRHAQVEAALAAYRMGRRVDAHDHLDQARALPSAGLEATVRLDAVQADVELWLDHETAAGARTADRAVAAADQMASLSGGLDGLSPEARQAFNAALEVAIDGAMQQDRGDDIVPLTEQCVRVAAGLDDEAHLAALVRAGMALRPFGRLRESEAHYRQAWDASKRLVLPVVTVQAGQGLARCLYNMGRFAEAHALAMETAQLETRLPNAPRHWGSAASVLHLNELSFVDAAAALRALRRDAAEEPDPHYGLAIHQAIAAWQARFAGAKAATDVESELEAAHAASLLARCPRCGAELSVTTAELLARIGRSEDARQELADWDRRSRFGHHQRDLLRMRAAAAIAAADRDDEAAVAILESYMEELERAGMLSDLIWARIDLGRSLTRLDRERAGGIHVGGRAG
jgi:hypothetical protein